MLTLFEFVFWACVLVLAAVYVGYPLTLPVLARVLRKPHRAEDIEPTVMQVISAYNEAAVIREKIENSLALDYPDGKLGVLVISDASDDGTDEVVAQYAERRVTLRRSEPRGGKSLGLTRFVPEIDSDIIVFSDANSMYDPDAIRKLVRHFADPDVGYVVGHQRYVENLGSRVSESERAYWDYEVKLKQWESDLSSVVGGDGAIYAIRSELFTPLSEDDINDFVNPLQIVARGRRGVFEPEAICYEESAQSFEGEFRRKVRIVNRALRGLLKVREVLNPARTGWFSYQITLHKLLRWFSPYFAIGAFAGALGATYFGGAVFYPIVVVLVVAVAGVALMRFLPPFAEMKFVTLVYFACMSNVAALLGTAKAVSGEKFTMWQPER